MKSSIKIDFQQGFDLQNRVNGHHIEPCIKVVLSESDDPRDKLLKSFFEKMGYESRYLVCEFLAPDDSTQSERVIHIHPIKSEDLQILQQELKS